MPDEPGPFGPDPFDQAPAGARFGWGLAGARALGRSCTALVVVDVLSFSTAVSVAAERGIRVYPQPSQEAERLGAQRAVGRSEVDAAHPWSLSPAALRAAPHTERLVLPSPNGGSIAAAGLGPTVVTGCLRNASAVAGWLAGQGWATAEHPVGVVAAGERWPDGELRPALEDLLGAGAVLAVLQRSGASLSAEAHAAAAALLGLPDVARAVADSCSGRELAGQGFAADVAVAVELDVARCVPVLGDDGAFA